MAVNWLSIFLKHVEICFTFLLVHVLSKENKFLKGQGLRACNEQNEENWHVKNILILQNRKQKVRKVVI